MILKGIGEFSMEVVNYLDIARKNLCKTFMNCMKIEYNKEEDYYYSKSFKNEKRAREIFESLKKNEELFSIYAQALFISNYLTAAFYAESSTAPHAQEELEYYESYEDIDDFIDNFDFDEFTEMFFEMCSFLDDGYYDKRQYVYSAEEKLECLRGICPLFIYDYIYYMNTYNTDELMNNYYINIADARSNPSDTERVRKKKEKIALKDTIMMNVDELIILSENDFDNYKYLICKMAEDVFRYLNYKLENKEKVTKEEKAILVYIEKDLSALVIASLNNEIILSHLVRIFINYNILNDEEYKTIDKYYDKDEKREKLNRVLTKSQKIKGEIK